MLARNQVELTRDPSSGAVTAATVDMGPVTFDPSQIPVSVDSPFGITADFHGTRYERSDEDTIRAFQKILLDANVLTMVRRTRGDDIDAACGQLKGQVVDRTRRQAEFRRKLEGNVADAA